MKRSNLLMTGVALLTVFSTVSAGESVSLKSDQEKLSYAMGVATGRALAQNEVKVSPRQFVSGLEDGASHQPLKMSDKTYKAVMDKFRQDTMKRLKAKMKAEAATNLQQSKAFQAANKLKPGVVTTASGLQYKIVTPGKGVPATTNDEVTVSYEGKLINGKVFDSTYKRGEPATLSPKRVIKGWQEALVNMKPGATWMLYVPAKLGYGKKGIPGVVGPNQLLIFKVKLIKVTKGSAPK